MTYPPIRTILMGTSDFAVPSFNKILDSSLFDVVKVFTQPDRPANRGKKIIESSVSKLLNSIDKGDLLLKPSSLKGRDIKSLIKDLNIDVIFIVSYGQILDKEILSIPTFGAINLHASLLPKHRGASPIQSAILSGDEVSGVSFFQLSEKVDDGPIIWQDEVPLNGDETFASLHDYLSDFGSNMVVKVLSKYVYGELHPIEQNHSEATHCGKISKSDGEILWGVYSAEEIERRVRAFNPWPSSYTLFKENSLKVHTCSVSEKRPHMLPGTVYKEDGEIYVRAKNKSILLGTVQMSGKKSCNIKEFVNGQNSFVGVKL